MQLPDPTTFQSIGGRYWLISRIGSGGQATVWRAVDTQNSTDENGAPVAIKIYQFPKGDQWALANLQQEVAALKKLNHPHILRYRDHVVHRLEPGQDGADSEWDLFFLVTDQINDAVTLWDFVQQRGPVEANEAARLMLPIVDALCQVHDAHLVHRDISFNNILIRDPNSAPFPVLIDFGLARETSIDGEKPLPAGTLEFLSPEQANEPQKLKETGVETDIWALGVVLFLLVTGKLPFGSRYDDGEGSLLQRIKNRRLPLAPLKQAGCPRPLFKIIQRCLEKNSLLRWTAPKLKLELQGFVKRGLKHRVHAAAWSLRTHVWTTEHPMLAAGAIVGMLACVLFLPVMLGLFLRERTTSEKERLTNSNLANTNSELVRERDEKSIALGRERTAKEQEQQARRAENRVFVDSMLTEAYRSVDAASPNYQLALSNLRNAHQDEQNDQRRLIHRRRIGMVQQAAVRLTNTWSHQGVGTSLISAGGQIFSAGADGIVYKVDRNGRGSPMALNHGSPIRRLAASVDGKWLIVASERMWSIWNTTEKHAVLTAPTAYDITAITISPTGGAVALGVKKEDQSSIWILALSASGTVTPLSSWDHRQFVRALQFSPNGQYLAYAGGDNEENGEVAIWSMPQQLEVVSRRDLPRGESHSDDVLDLAISMDGSFIATSSYDRRGRVWTFPELKPVTGWLPHRDPVEDVEFSPDGQRVLTASFDHVARIWSTDPADASVIQIEHDGPVYQGRFSETGWAVATASFDNFVRIVPLDDPRQIRIIQQPTAVVAAIPFEDGHVVTLDRDGVARSWDIRGEIRESRSTELPGQEPHHLAMHPKNGLLAVGSGRHVVVFDQQDWSKKTEIDVASNVLDLRWIAEGNRLTVITHSGCSVWTLTNETQNLTASLLSHQRLSLRRGKCTTDGRSALIVTESGDAFACRPMEDGLQMTRLGSANGPKAVDGIPAPEGRRWYVLGVDQVLYSFVENGEVKRQSLPLGGLTSALAISSDGQRLAVGGIDGQIWLIDAESLSMKSRIDAHAKSARVETLAFSPDGKLLASGSYDRTAQLWDVDEGTARGVRMVHLDEVRAVAFNDDGTLVATADGGWGKGDEGSIRVWEVDSGLPISPRLKHSNDAHAVLFTSPNTLVSASFDKTLREWDLTPAQESSLKSDGQLPLHSAKTTQKWIDRLQKWHFQQMLSSYNRNDFITAERAFRAYSDSIPDNEFKSIAIGNMETLLAARHKDTSGMLSNNFRNLHERMTNQRNRMAKLPKKQTAKTSDEIRADAAASLIKLEGEYSLVDPSTKNKMREGGLYFLHEMANAAFDAGHHLKATAYANELLRTINVEDSGQNWNYGNAIHETNMILGQIALMNDKSEEAKKFLLAAGQTPGSPQLNSFGPRFVLAADLLKVGEKEAVLQYFELCRTFWESGGGRLNEWKKTIEAGQTPDFFHGKRYTRD